MLLPTSNTLPLDHKSAELLQKFDSSIISISATELESSSGTGIVSPPNNNFSTKEGFKAKYVYKSFVLKRIPCCLRLLKSWLQDLSFNPQTLLFLLVTCMFICSLHWKVLCPPLKRNINTYTVKTLNGHVPCMYIHAHTSHAGFRVCWINTQCLACCTPYVGA